MTLHEAISHVLKESGIEMTPREIAIEINNRQLYLRKDRTPVKPVQISARIGHYLRLFQVSKDGKIGLINRRILPFKELATKLTNHLYATSFLNSNHIRVLVILLVYISWKRHPHFFLHNNRAIKDDQLLEFIYDIEGFDSDNRTVIENYLSVFQALSRQNILDIVQVIQSVSIEDNIPTSEFGPFFNDLVNDFNWRENYRAGEYYTPSYLVSFLSKIIKIEKFSVVKDQFSDNASLLIGILNENRDKNIQIVASGNNPENILIGTLNLMANGCHNFIYSNSGDTLDFKVNNAFDCIVSKPPFGGRLNQPFIWASPDGQQYQTFDLVSAAIASILVQLKPFGRAYVIAPIGFLIKQDKFTSSLRKFLIKERLLSAVIALPKDTFKPYTGVLTTMLVIDSKVDLENRLLYYDATKYSTEAITNYSSEFSTLLSNEKNFENGKNYRFIDYSLIEERNFQLEKNLYFNSDFLQLHSPDLGVLNKIGINTIKSNLNDFYQGQSIKPINLNSIEGIPYVQVSDLSDNIGINILDLSKVKRYVSDIELISGEPRYVLPNSVLISKVGAKLKPTLYSENSKILCSNNIIVLQPSSRILAEYLVAILQSETIDEQVDLIRSLSGVPNFRLHDFLSIFIRVPSIEEQQKYITRYFTRQFQEQAEFKEKEEADDLYSIVSRIKHELMQTVSSIGMDIRLIKEYLEQKEKDGVVISLKDPLITILPGMEAEAINRSRLESVITRMQKCQKDAWETLQKVEETLKIGANTFNPEEFMLKMFLQDEILPIYENANCVINILGEEHIIKGDKYQLKVLFKNLIDNAINRGFNSNKLKQENIINIRLKGLDPEIRHYVIVIENNGTPLPQDFKLPSSSKTGISDSKNRRGGFGLYHCKKVIENHNGMWEVEDADNLIFTDFKVRFSIAIPE